MDDLAVLLDTPEDWQERYNQIVADENIILDMDDFRSLPDGSQLIRLVFIIASSLRVRIQPKSETKIIVGGIAEIEDEIAEQEKKEYQKQTSEFT